MATSAFGKAFRAAREAGDKEFEFGGKKYNTKMKYEDSAPSKTDATVLAAKGQAGNEEMKKDEAASKPDFSNEGRGSKPKVSTDYTPGRVPSSAQAAANREEAVDKVKSVAGAIGNYFRDFKTPAERRSDEAKQASGMKKGGSVSSASSRGDGIAQRGKTRGKMC
jgi:hypothetical protein